jgi:hypothetical protein
MKIEGVLKEILPPQSGVGKNGPWSKQQIIIEVQEPRPHLVCFTIKNGKFSSPGFLEVGKTCMVDFNIDCKEYQGRWYTELVAWNIQVIIWSYQVDNE